jgi:hypothetical protein
MSPLMPALLNRLRHGGYHLVLLGHVGDAPARHVGAQLGRGRLQPVPGQPGEVNPRALRHEQAGAGQPDPALAAGDQGDLLV